MTKIVFGKYSYYEGETKDGRPHGDGVIKLKDGKTKDGISLFCKFEDGHPIGEGTYINGIGNKIIGEFDIKLNLKNKFGKLIYKNGSIYEGGFEGRIQHGEGKETWKNGTKVKGIYDMGIFVEGAIIFTNGIITEGTFKNYKLHGEGKMTLENGKIIKGTWNEGDIVETK